MFDYYFFLDKYLVYFLSVHRATARHLKKFLSISLDLSLTLIGFFFFLVFFSKPLQAMILLGENIYHVQRLWRPCLQFSMLVPVLFKSD